MLSKAGRMELMERQGERPWPTGGYLIPPGLFEGIAYALNTVGYIDLAELERKMEPSLNHPDTLSPREEALLRDSPVFHLSLLEPQPDVVISLKEPQC